MLSRGAYDYCIRMDWWISTATNRNSRDMASDRNSLKKHIQHDGRNSLMGNSIERTLRTSALYNFKSQRIPSIETQMSVQVLQFRVVGSEHPPAIVLLDCTGVPDCFPWCAGRSKAGHLTYELIHEIVQNRAHANIQLNCMQESEFSSAISPCNQGPCYVALL